MLCKSSIFCYAKTHNTNILLKLPSQKISTRVVLLELFNLLVNHIIWIWW